MSTRWLASLVVLIPVGLVVAGCARGVEGERDGLAHTLEGSVALADLTVVDCNETENFGPDVVQGGVPTAAVCGVLSGDDGSWDRMNTAAKAAEDVLGLAESVGWECEAIYAHTVRCVAWLGESHTRGIYFALVAILDIGDAQATPMTASVLIDRYPGEFAFIATNAPMP